MVRFPSLKRQVLAVILVLGGLTGLIATQGHAGQLVGGTTHVVHLADDNPPPVPN